jgi:putative membrane protein
MQFGMMNGYGMGFGIMMLIFWIAVIIGLVLLIKYLSEGGAKRREESALEILQKKYARGEISKEEFEEKKKDLL